MKKILHIVATPRYEQSRTLQISNTFFQALKEKQTDWEVETLNLFDEDLPELTVKRIDGKYELLSGKDLSEETEKSWEQILGYIDQFKSADAFFISCPMWNFSIPYVLKHYIDIIMQPKYLFQYTQNGPEGLVKNKQMIVVTSRGGDYSIDETSSYDLQEPYLRTVFGFAGITDIRFLNAQPMDAAGGEVQKVKIEAAQKEMKNIFSDIYDFAI